jgi:hypothetical protein
VADLNAQRLQLMRRMLAEVDGRDDEAAAILRQGIAELQQRLEQERDAPKPDSA